MMAVCLVWGVCPAAPLNKNHILADSKWICHVDLEAFRATQLGKLVQDDIRQNWQTKIDSLNELFGSDITRDVHSVTLFGSKPGEEDAVVMIYGKFNQNKLTALLALNSSYQKSQYNGAALHHWTDDRDHKNRVGAFAQDNLIVISQTESKVTSVLDILSGKASSLAAQQANPLVPLTEVPQNTFVLAAAVGLDELTQDDKNAAILQNSRLMAFIGTEEQGNVITRLRLETQDAQAAEQIETALRGILAFITLSQKENPDIAALIGACTISRQQSILNVQFQYPSQALMDIIKGFTGQQPHDPNQSSEDSNTK